jgi:TolB protein
MLFTAEASGATGPAIYSLEIGGTGAVLLPGTVGGEAPAWSPDGKSIAYTTGREIWVMNADGSNPRDIHHIARTDEEPPVWSPDGRMLAFLEAPECAPCSIGMTWGLMVMNADGSSVRKVGDSSSSSRPAWLPDGQGLIFTGDLSDPPAPTNGLQVIRLDGSGLHQLTTGADSDPAVSLDGRLAFLRDTSEAADGTILYSLYVANLDGSDARQIPMRVIAEAPLAWSPDGAWIAVMGTTSLPIVDAGQWDIWLVSTVGGGTTNLTNTRAVSENFPAWH